MLAPACACADEVVGTVHDWDAPPATPEPWYRQRDVVDLTTPGSGGHGGGYLNVRFPEAGGTLPENAFDIVYTRSSSLFAGQWTHDMWVDFEFKAIDGSSPPDHIQIWWGVDGGNTWMSDDLNFGDVTDWTKIQGPRFDFENWTADMFGLDEDDFLTDLGNIDWIGIYIWRGDSSEQIYGIDNFRLMIPEPSEWAMLALALAVSVVAVRRQRRNRVTASTPG
jgi:hypothetical protein